MKIWIPQPGIKWENKFAPSLHAYTLSGWLKTSASSKSIFSKEENLKLKTRCKQSILVTNVPCRAEKWAEVIMASGLPYSTIQKEPFRSFIEKEVGYKLPS